MPHWLGGPEIVILVLVIVIVFGWKKLPDAARSLGRSMRIFKSEVDELKGDTSASAASRDTVDGEAVHRETTTHTSHDDEGSQETTRTVHETTVSSERPHDVRSDEAGGSTSAPRA